MLNWFLRIGGVNVVEKFTLLELTEKAFTDAVCIRVTIADTVAGTLADLTNFILDLVQLMRDGTVFINSSQICDAFSFQDLVLSGAVISPMSKS